MELDLEKVKKQLNFSSKKCQKTVKSKLYGTILKVVFTEKNKETKKTHPK